MSSAAKVTTKMSASVASATVAAAEALAAGAPKSVLSIPSVVRHGSVALSDLTDKNGRQPGAAIRQVGCTRRIFLLDPNGQLSSEEMEGLAYRIKMLSKNTSLNSIMCTSNLEKTENAVNPAIPTSVLQLEREAIVEAPNELFERPTREQDLPTVASGYDHRLLQSLSGQEKRKTLIALRNLALAVKGNVNNPQANTKGKNGNGNGGGNVDESKIPFISAPSGITTDGGYALSMGSYVLATPDSRFQIMNPMRGLSLDPIGLSYILPRLGWEFQQQSALYPVGMVLGLTGFVADASDMVETGLATNFVDSATKLGSLERALANLTPYEHQKLIKEPTKKYGQTDDARSRNRDINAKHRNVAVSGLLSTISNYDAMGQDMYDSKLMAGIGADEDPTLVLDADKLDIFGDRVSMLVNIAGTFQEVFEKQDSVEGIMEKMREYASASAKTDEEIEFVHVAKDLLYGMESQSPLALCATHELLKLGKGRQETLSSCMGREMRVQLKLLEKDDFNDWAKSGMEAGEFKDWNHKSVKDVTKDEIEELLK